MSTSENESKGPGFALFGLLVGLATGFVVYAIAEYWVDEVSNERLSLTVLSTVAVFAAALLLLAERGAQLRAVPAAAIIAAILAFPTYTMLVVADDNANLASFPAMFWFLIGAPLSGYLMTTLVKSSLLEKTPPPYSAVFFHGLTLPLIAVGAHLFALLALVLIFAWAALLRAMDVDFFHKLFQEPWFMLPFLGAVGGLSIAMMRGMQSVLGALRYLLLLFSRIAMPITAVFSLTFVAVLLVNGTDAIFERPYPGGMMLALAFAGMLIFNGVYQNGEGGPPPAWLRLATIIALITFPIYAGLAAYAFWLRIGEYGLTPARIVGAATNGLAALYSVVCLAGILTELNWGGRRWMPLVAPLNTWMATVWIVVLVGLSTVINPWAISAKSQEARLASGKIAAAEFDYGYMRFSLGEYGEAALDRLLELRSHPESAEIRTGVSKARKANNQWEYDYGAVDNEAAMALAADSSEPDVAPGPMQLEFNPDDADIDQSDAGSVENNAGSDD